MSGCYDGQEMVDRVAKRVADDRRAEVALGTYEITLPRSDHDPVATTLRLEVVATVERHHAREMNRQLKGVRTQLRHATILTLRESQRQDLLEPKLVALRRRIAETTKEHLTAAPIESIAFRSFAVYED